MKGPKWIKDFQVEIVELVESHMAESRIDSQVYNQLEDIVLAANIFKDGLMTKDNVIHAQENFVLFRGVLERGF